MPPPWNTSISISAPSSGIAGVSFTVTGILTDTDNGVPVPGKTASLSYNGTPIGSDTTGGSGGYSISATINEASMVGVPWVLTISFAGDATYLASSNTSLITIIGVGSEDLHVQFWLSKWRVPGKIESDLYGGLICIDPNGLRSSNKGPFILVLDELIIKPGKTDKSGSMQGSINDNENSDFHPQDPREEYELLAENSIWTDDDVEFWIGFQRGPDPGGNEPHGSWDTTGGSDGKGSGRKWIMGGYLNDRYYKNKAKEITAVMVGKCYMDVWKDMPFGIPTNSRNYTTATDVADIASDLVDDVNALQPAGYRYTTHPTYWPAVTGTEWAKEFKQTMAIDVMQDIVDEIGYEWKIDYRKRVLLYERTSSPYPSVSSPAYSIRFTTNIREISKMCMGDTTERFTHIIATDAHETDMPPDIDAWCLNAGLWRDLTSTSRGHSSASLPAPSNPKDAIYSDITLIIDDEGHPALCYQSDVQQFNLNLSFYADAGSNLQWVDLHLDLREFRRLKFRFRHPTRTMAGSLYRIQLRNSRGPDIGYYYDFGKGAALSPQLVAGDTDHDTVDSDEWSEIDLLLPEIDVDGSLLDLHGWVELGVPDPTDIGWPSLYLTLSEPNPGLGPGQALIVVAAVGDEYLSVANPGEFAGIPAAYSSEFRFWQEAVCLLQKGATSEEVCIRGTSLPSIPAGYNIELAKGILNAYNLVGATPHLYRKGGWTACFSQFHFERNLRVTEEATSPTPPYRYRLMVSKEMEHLNEAVARANSILEQETGTKQYVRLSVDGHPEFEIGNKTRTYLGISPFNNVGLIIDDIEYRLAEDQDLQVTLFLGTQSQRPRELNELTVLDQQERHITNLGLGKTGVVRR